MEFVDQNASYLDEQMSNYYHSLNACWKRSEVLKLLLPCFQFPIRPLLAVSVAKAVCTVLDNHKITLTEAVLKRTVVLAGRVNSSNGVGYRLN